MLEKLGELLNFYFKIHLCVCLIRREQEQVSKLLCTPIWVHFPNACHSQAWAGLKSGSWELSPGFPQRFQEWAYLSPSFVTSQDLHQQEPRVRSPSQQPNTCTPVWDTGLFNASCDAHSKATFLGSEH